MRTQYKNIAILSAELSHLDDYVNAHRHMQLKGILQDLGLSSQEVTGVYKGTKERSLIVLLPDFETQQVVVDIALKTFSQESILVRDNENHARLIYKEYEHYLGTMQAISQAEASRLNAYTITNDGQYWAVK